MYSFVCRVVYQCSTSIRSLQTMNGINCLNNY